MSPGTRTIYRIPMTRRCWIVVTSQEASWRHIVYHNGQAILNLNIWRCIVPGGNQLYGVMKSFVSVLPANSFRITLYSMHIGQS